MKNDNPFNMEELTQYGGFVLGEALCTERRKDFLLRGNNILTSFTIIANLSNFGYQYINKQDIPNERRMRLTIGKRFIQCKNITLKDMYIPSLKQLANQTFVSIYGNFEAYLIDILIDALERLGESNPQQESMKILAMRGWEGKIDSIGQKLNIKVGKGKFREKFKDIPMEIEGKACSDAISFLQNIADVRHLIVHTAGRVDARLAKNYPDANLKEGDEIAIPVELAFDLHIFLVSFTEIFDKAFSERFKWEQKVIHPKYLVKK